MFEKESKLIEKEKTRLELDEGFVVGTTEVDGLTFSISLIEKKEEALHWEVKNGVSVSTKYWRSSWYFRLAWHDVGLISQLYPCPDWMADLAEETILQS